MLDMPVSRPAFDPARIASPTLVGSRVMGVALLDTAVSSDNLGDEVIMDAVRTELDGLFDGARTFTINSHEQMGRHSRIIMSRADLAIAGGTNLLSSRMWWRPNWNLRPWDVFMGARTRTVLMGVGWWQYQGKPDPYSAWLLRSMLSRTHLHSVRESFAKTMLAAAGITNVVNTGCPTIWNLTPEHCATLPKRKAKAVVATINSYAGLRSPEADRRMLQMLKGLYDEVYLWIQTDSDYGYASGLADGLKFVNPNLKSYDALLGAPIDLDYVGNRLHAGIRALQHGRRAVILEIDNRATEMGRDFGVPTLPREDFERLEAAITKPQAIAVKPPADAIRRWKDQFVQGAPQP